MSFLSKRQIRRQISKSTKSTLENIKYRSEGTEIPILETNMNMNQSGTSSTSTLVEAVSFHSFEDFSVLNKTYPTSTLDLSTSPTMISADSNVESENFLFLNKFKQWALNHKITHKCLNDIIGLIKPKYPFLNKDARTILGTPRNTEVIELENGEMVYFGIEKELLKRGKDLFALAFNIDGIPLFKNS